MEIKTEIIKIRCTNKEKIRLKEKAQLSGKTLSECCRELLNNGKVLAIPHFSTQELEGIAYLRKYERYFRYISNFMKQRDIRLYKETRDLTELIRTVITRFYQHRL